MARSKGCTIALIILVVLIVIILIGIVILWLNKDKIIEAGINYMTETVETEIIANLPEGYTEAEVHEIMGDLKTAIANDEISGPELQELVNISQAALADKTIDKDEARNLLQKIQLALGQTPPEVQEMPEDSLPDSMQVVPDSA